MKFIKKHFSVAKKMLYEMNTILRDNRLVGCSEIKKNGCDVLMIKGNTKSGFTPVVTYLNEI